MMRINTLRTPASLFIALLMATLFSGAHAGSTDVTFGLNGGNEGGWSNFYTDPVAACETGYYDLSNQSPNFYPAYFVWSSGEHGCAFRKHDWRPGDSAAGYAFVWGYGCPDGEWFDKNTAQCVAPQFFVTAEVETPLPPKPCPNDCSHAPKPEDSSPPSGAGSPREAPSSMVGNPIDVATGIKIQREIDFVGKGPQPISFTRIYDSSSNFDTGLGIGWSHNFQRDLRSIEPKTGIAYDPSLLTHSNTFQNQADACQTGWDAVKLQRVEVELRSAKARFELGSCNLISGGKIIGRVQVHSTLGAPLSIRFAAAIIAMAEVGLHHRTLKVGMTLRKGIMRSRPEFIR